MNTLCVATRLLGVLALGLAGVGLAGCRSARQPPPQQALAAPTPRPVAPPAIPVRFTDITKQAGIRFKHTNGVFGARLMPESVGSGVVFIDYDGDGYQDLFFVNSRNWTDAEVRQYQNSKWSPSEYRDFRAHHPGAPMVRAVPANRPRQHVTGALYHNNGDGTFTDVTKGSGLDVEMFGMGAAVGDYDNDGRPDLFVTSWGHCYLFHNEGHGKFRDVTAAAGLLSPGWSTSAAWVDYDKDGKLDLFVCHYALWTPATDVYFSYDGEHKSYIGPRFYQGEPSHLYHNLGGGKFEDVSARAGIVTMQTKQTITGQKLVGRGLGIAICDYNNDGWPDLLVTNDMTPNFLYQNRGDGTFKEVAVAAGIALDNSGLARAGMGVDTADIDRSGYESAVIGNFSHEMLGLYLNRGGVFRDIAPQTALGPISDKFLTFGIAFLDYDNDGWPDIFVSNGHVSDDIAKVNHGIEYAEHPLLFRNLGDLNFEEVGAKSGSALQQKTVARGLAYADIDLDGDLDVVISTSGRAAVLLRNDGGNQNHSLRVVLQGTKSNRSGIGARVEARAGTGAIRRTVRSGSSYCSQSELPVTLGLGRESAAQSVTVFWPSGAVTRLGTIDAGQIITVNESRGLVKRERLHYAAPPSYPGLHRG